MTVGTRRSAADRADTPGVGARLGVRARRLLGGSGRTRVVLLLGAVLALNSADTGAIGAAAAQLEADLGISHAQLGLLASASSGVGALAAIPMGMLADRVHRVRLLAVTVAAWAVAMVAGGLAADYRWLLVSRLLLGAAVAASGPVVVSLTGDFIPPADRAAVLGWILTGEIVGAGVGLVAGGEVAAALSWRSAFFLLAAASLVLAVALLWQLPEPARGGAGWLRGDRRTAPDDACGGRTTGADDRTAGGRVAGADGRDPAGEAAGARDGGRGVARENGGLGARSGEAGDDHTGDEAHEVIAARGIAPAPGRVLPAGAADMSLARAAVYLLRIPSNRLLIIASVIGYFFFAGLRTFAVVFATQHYRVSQTALGAIALVVGVTALAGAVAGGRYTDRILRHGRADARILVPAAGYTAAALLLLPGFLLSSVALALPLIALGTAALAAANPPLDAARLDIVPARMWGRAESLRTLLRLAAEGIAPATFGLLADALAGDGGPGEGAIGLRDTFLVMLVPLLANGLLMLLARGSYPVDVATATASDRQAHR
ncbi:MFS transporter [Micromonospora sp. HM5-17]|nr:MFS transporter [Micromonospora sp. HM5-17]